MAFSSLQTIIIIIIHRRCPYHPIFCFRLLWWAKQLRWCGLNCPCSTRITFAQLYLDFSVATESIAPVNMAPGKARSWKGFSLDYKMFPKKLLRPWRHSQKFSFSVSSGYMPKACILLAMTGKRWIAQMSLTGLASEAGFLPLRGDRNWLLASVQL